jgi:ubiquinone/menaquinone biosynthesis C-methylase UbiE
MDPVQPATVPDVTDEWLDAHLPTVFSSAHDANRALLRGTIEAVIAAAGVAPGQAVLDVGGGSGIPTIDVARRVGPSGRVVAAEPSPVFADAMEANLRREGLTNVEVIRAGAAALDLPPRSFDAATCHMAAMFFPDLQAGLTRIRELLKPGARAGFVAWGPDEENTFLGAFFGAAGPYLPADAGPPAPADGDGPRPNRFAKPGTLSAALERAGFTDVREEAPIFDFAWPDGVESLRDFMLELTRIEARVAADRHTALRADIDASYGRFAGAAGLRFPTRMIVASGRA